MEPLNARPLFLWGFGPFEDWPHNSTIDVTLEACLLLQGRGIWVERAIHEVALEPVRDAVAKAAATRPLPRAVLACGLNGAGRCIEVERLAHNEAKFRRPDKWGYHALGEPLVEGGNPSISPALSTEAVLEILAGQGIPAVGSDDAGRYLCNAIYYLALEALGAQGVPVLFLHIPPDLELSSAVDGVFPGRGNPLYPMDRGLQARALEHVALYLLDSAH